MLRAALLSLGFAAASAMAADVVLPAPAVGPARASEESAAAAGDRFLVAWIDPRGICAARIGADGTLLDRSGIIVASKPNLPENLIAVGGDDHWTLFWNDRGLRAARIGLDGNVLDGEPKRLESVFSKFDVVRDGGRFALLSAAGRLFTIDGNLDSIAEVGATCLPGDVPVLAASGNGYLAALDDRLTFFDAAGRRLRESTLPGGVNTCRLASAGGVYMVAWTSGPNGDTLTVASYDGEGRALVPARTISPPVPASGRIITFAMTANGAGYTTVSSEIDFDDTRRSNVRMARFAPNGSPIETRVIGVDGACIVLALASAGATNFLVTTVPAELLLEGRVFQSLAAFPVEPQIPSIVFREHEIDGGPIVATGNGFAAIWAETITPSSNKGRSRTAVHFVASGAEPLDLGPGANLTLATDGEAALAAWSDGELRARLLPRSGPPRDIAVPAGPIRELASGWTGRAYLLLWHDGGGAMHSVAISSTGNVSQPRDVASNISALYSGDLSLACNGHGCVAAGTFSRSQTVYDEGDPAIQNLLTVRFDEDGNPVAPAHRKTIVSNWMRPTPFFDSRGGAFVLFGAVARVDGAYIAPITADGAVASPETAITANPADQPRLATESGFYSIRDTHVGERLTWTWITLTPQPAVLGSVDLGEPVGAIAVRGGSAFAFVRLGPSKLAIREIPPPSTKRRRAS